MSKKAAKKTRKRPAKKGARKKAAASRRCSCPLCRALTPATGKIVTLGLGQVIEITYKHADDGKRYKHRFKKHAALHAADRGQVLIIEPVRLTAVNAQHFIGD